MQPAGCTRSANVSFNQHGVPTHGTEVRTVVVFRRLCRATTLAGTLRRAGLANIMPASCTQLGENAAMAFRRSGECRREQLCLWVRRWKLRDVFDKLSNPFRSILIGNSLSPILLHVIGGKGKGLAVPVTKRHPSLSSQVGTSFGPLSILILQIDCGRQSAASESWTSYTSSRKRNTIHGLTKGDRPGIFGFRPQYLRHSVQAPFLPSV
jgi:hypothetical protein